ncbi:organic solvent tolerance protein [Pelagibacterales bacterium SAG-MED48]|nr:organic solvent tolerance protein [Pelagibacterales bacterium SAG-MED48]
MINKILYIFLILILNIITSSSIYAAEVFNFDVTEVEIIEEGNKFLGKNGGTATSNDGTVIKANNFEYDKLRNILIAIGDVEIDDKKENIIITSQKVTYFKNKEFIFSEGQSQAISEGIIINADNFEYNKITNVIDANGDVKIDNKSENYLIYTNNATYLKNEELFLTKGQSQAINEGIIIDADNFEYNKITNIINANGDVKIKDSINDYLILANDATYYKNLEKIITNGDTEAFIQSRYIINSKDVTYLHNDKILSSQHKSKIKDQDSQVYFAEKFNYLINEEIIKGEKFLIITNYNLPKSDKFFLEDGIINLKNKKFIAKDTKIKIHKNIFANTENDPRIEGVSSKGDENITIINKGVFTSCKKNDTCPPWSIQSDIIKHDKIKKTLNYKNAVLKIYDFPVLYLPKFFHPDPSVKRQSGLLQPEINDSNVLGGSLTLPYFKVISENKDLTLTPIWFDTDTLMSSLEYRQENKNSNFLSDFAFVNNYQSYTTKKTNSLSHLFLKYNLDLSLENFNSSDLNISIQKVSNDTYLNVFDQYITKSKLRPGNFNQLTNNAVLNLDHQNYNFETGVLSYENLRIKKQSDRYQYVLPYYNFNKNISQNYFDGNLSFGSSGNNVLNNTNKLETNIINNITYNSLDFISNLGFKNNFGINLKNLNSIGKKSTKYKSITQSELISLYNMDVSMPLIKESEISKNLLTPKLSFRFNPSDMKNYSTTGRTIDANNVWTINRLGLSDTYESGRSLTLGLNYSKERKDKLNQINNYFEMKLATILRDKEEKFIPNNSTLNRINSNLFGSVTNKFSDNIEIGYNFSLDNDLNTLEYNNIDTTISLNNIVTKFNFIEENGERGDSNIVGGSIAYNLDDKNFFSFKTRRNRKLNLTEFYDLVYQYKNDCLTAGIKYKKTYYSDGDLRPTQNLLFTVTLFPLTTYEYDANDLLEN